MDHPRIDADLDHGRRDHDGDENIGRRRRQSGAEDRAEDKGQQDHGDQIDARGLNQHAAELSWDASDDQRACHDRQGREQESQIGDHVGKCVEKPYDWLDQSARRPLTQHRHEIDDE